MPAVFGALQPCLTGTVNHRARVRALPIGLLFVFPVIASGQGYQGIEEQLPRAVDPQPIPFSHKQHTAAGVSCIDCHRGAEKRERAGLPSVGQCMLCHQTIKTESPAVVELAEFRREGKSLDWVRVYRVSDFVFFSHKEHAAADIGCAPCHGPVEQRDRLAKEVSTSMIMCMDCHKQTNASRSCHLCHELGQ